MQVFQEPPFAYFGAKRLLNVIPVYIKSGSKSLLKYIFSDQGFMTSLCADRLLAILDVTWQQTRFVVPMIRKRSVLRNRENVYLTVTLLAEKIALTDCAF